MAKRGKITGEFEKVSNENAWKTFGYSAQCEVCKHLVKRFVCPAFPHGIPEEILSCKIFHYKAHPRQEGDFVFTPVEWEDPA